MAPPKPSTDAWKPCAATLSDSATSPRSPGDARDDTRAAFTFARFSIGLGHLRVHDDGTGVNRDEVLEHAGLERVPRVKPSLILRGRLPPQLRHQRQVVVLHPHRALLGRVAAEQDGPLRLCHRAIIAPPADNHSDSVGTKR